MIDSIVNRGIEDQFGLHVQLNAPEFFEREDFIRYIETQTVFSHGIILDSTEHYVPDAML